MKRALVMVGFLLGCGPSFEGTYTGTLGLNEACDDGSSRADAPQVTWIVRADGRRLTITAGFGCDPVLGTVTDATDAIILAKTCPEYTTPAGLLARPGIVDGSLFLADPTIAVSMRTSVLFSNAMGCQINYLGSLVRVQ